VIVELVPGANIALRGDSIEFRLGGPFDLSALVLDESGQVSGDADMVFYNAPDAPGVRFRPGRLTVTPARLRRGATRVMVVASPERPGTTFGALPRPAAVVVDGTGATFSRLTTPALHAETVVLLAEVYQRGGGWKVRSIGQGYADGLAGLARDFGVEVDVEVVPSGGAAVAPPGGATGVPPDGAAVVAEVVDATNVERGRHGLRPLTTDARLCRAAQDHSADMVRRAFFAHENPDGAQVWDRAMAAGYVYRKVAENIAAGQRTADEVVRGWMNSPGHRANILDAELSQIGVGHAPGGSYGVYWTQVFGTPR